VKNITTIPSDALRGPSEPRCYAARVKLTATDLRWIERATAEAEKSEHRVRVGSAVVLKHRGSVSHNKIRNSPQICWQEASVHAEMGALRTAYRGGAGANIYVVRLGAKGALLPSFPCERCLPGLVEAGVKRIVWWDGRKWRKDRLSELGV
jgi:tRNA(Arg) A34 adenosine deaminase TadA